eukprot:jgi/Tetstr1/460948/TSEL_006100.t1
MKSCSATADCEYVSTNVEDGDNRHAQEWWWSTESGSSVRVCKEAWMFIHKVGFLRLRKIRAEVDGLVNPGFSRNTPPVYHIARRIATRAWLNDYFHPKHRRTENTPNPPRTVRNGILQLG